MRRRGYPLDRQAKRDRPISDHLSVVAPAGGA